MVDIVRAGEPEDLDQVAEIYAHYVTTSAATFELTAPDREEWARRFAAVRDAGLPFLVAQDEGKIAGYAYCAPWRPRPAYRQTVEDSVYVAPWAAGGVSAAGCSTNCSPGAATRESGR